MMAKKAVTGCAEHASDVHLSPLVLSSALVRPEKAVPNLLCHKSQASDGAPPGDDAIAVVPPGFQR